MGPRAAGGGNRCGPRPERNVVVVGKAGHVPDIGQDPCGPGGSDTVDQHQHVCAGPTSPDPATSAPAGSIDYLCARLSALHTPGTHMAMTIAPTEPMTGPAAPHAR